FKRFWAISKRTPCGLVWRTAQRSFLGAVRREFRSNLWLQRAPTHKLRSANFVSIIVIPICEAANGTRSDVRNFPHPTPYPPSFYGLEFGESAAKRADAARLGGKRGRDSAP